MSPKAALEINKDGSPSRKREHGGNLPTLERKYVCNICPSSFTRPNHLKRHLLTHSNTRKYHCEICRLQFTRRDLLNKHMDRCGGSSTSTRTRRICHKACKNCAKSKRKCDMKVPCSRCRSQGKGCVPSGEEIATEPKLDPETDADLVLLSRPYSEVFPPRGDSWDYGTSSSGSSSTSTPPPEISSEIADVDNDFMMFFTTPTLLSNLSKEDSEPCLPRQTEFDMQESLDLFLKHFTARLPIFHRATWKIENKEPLLVIIMQAYGAACLKSSKAQAFALSVMNSAPELLTASLDQCPPDLSNQLDLISAFLVLQSSLISNFRPQSEQLKETASAVMRMIARNKLVETVAGVEKPSMPEKSFSSIQAEWQRWVQYETCKRVLWTLYICNSTSNTNLGTELTSEVSHPPVPLPCTGEAWGAGTSMEWFWTLFGKTQSEEINHPLVGPSIEDVFRYLRGAPDEQVPYHSLQLGIAIATLLMELRRSLACPQQDDKDTQLHTVLATQGKSHKVFRILGERLDLEEVRSILRNWISCWRKRSVDSEEGSGTGQLFCGSNVEQLHGTAHLLLLTYEMSADE